MRGKLFFGLLLLMASIKSFSQETPMIKVGEDTIDVKKLYVHTEVIGDIAITTFDMYFYNSNNRVLEGELSFPLGEGQSVTRFALEINDNLREAVVVEKEKARVAFETTVRNKIDPALLEQTKGNNYKARIYPIPAKGYKRVVLAFQQKLIHINDAYHYKLPFNFKNKLEEFSFEMVVLNQKNKPVFQEGMFSHFKYDSDKELYHTAINKEKETIAKPIFIKIPLNAKNEKIITTDDYFYFTKKLALEKRTTVLEDKITIFWDASLSQKDKKIATELSLLDMYFNKVKKCKVNLVVFDANLRFKNKFKVENGNWKSLKNTLDNIIYDGGSSFSFLKDYKDTSIVNLLFTDGLNTLSDAELNLTKKTFIINSSQSANHIDLKNIANLSGGSYLNVNQSSVKNAFSKFTEENLVFLGSNYADHKLEIYPKKGTVVTENFSLSGKGNFLNKNIELKFGYGNTVLEIVSFKLKESSLKNKIVAKIWAQKKLENLLKDKKENEAKIVKLSKQCQVISPFTSMLILDRIEDYVTHKIPPPEELRNEYDELIAKQVDNRKQRFHNLQENLLDSYIDFFSWYGKDFEVKETEESRRNARKSTIREVVTDTPLTEDEVIISGVVKGKEDNSPLPGVSVEVKGKTSGTDTDFDGDYSLRVNVGDVLEFSSIGYISIQKRIENSNRINVLLAEDQESLDEVVVVGYGSVREQNITGAVSRVSSEDIAQVSVSRADEALEGRIPGIHIQNNAKQITEFKKLVTNKIELKGWNPNTPYLYELNKTKNNVDAYDKYVALRKEYGTSPSFYIDVADFFKKKNEEEKAIQILSNVAEIDLDNYELLKALAYKFEEYKLYDFAVYTYKEILKLRPEDVQSYRDLALVYENTKEYQKSTDLLYQIVNGELLMKDENRRFLGVEVIALNEFNRMLNLYKSKLKTHHYDAKFIQKMATDFRVVIDWNHNDTDIDLWVIDPNEEKCYYSHKKTIIGGLMSDDMTAGFGPEQFVIKKAIDGVYKIKTKYYSNSQQKISGPTFLKVTVFKNYGKKGEVKTTKLIRLKEKDEVLDIGEIVF